MGSVIPRLHLYSFDLKLSEDGTEWHTSAETITSLILVSISMLLSDFVG
jgi:hypothetical protein